MAAPHANSNESCKSADLDKLQDAVEFIDGISQEGCSEIIATTNLMLAFLERPDRFNEVETIAQAIQAIKSKAELMQSGINEQANELGCGHIDIAARRRAVAQQPTYRHSDPA